jgi:uncharacterized protein YbaP (TraB family)
MKKLGIIIAFLGLSFGIQAQEQFTGSLLWKISGKDLKKPSYVLGTHHAVTPDYVDSIAGLRQTLKQVKQVVGEVDMSEMESAVTIMVKYSAMPEGYSYKSMLTDAQYQLLDSKLKEFAGYGMETFGNLHPATIQMTLVQLCCAKIFPEFLNPNFEPIDGYIQTIARKQKKSILGLETLEDQLKVLYNAEPIESQVKTLICLVQYMDEAVEQLLEITQFYYRKDLNAIYKLYDESNQENSSDEDCQVSAAYMDGLNKNRNDNWLRILPDIMKSKSSLIVVGAMHIAGKDGLLYKLHQMGYTVEAVIE